jgi:hypothetical protein
MAVRPDFAQMIAQKQEMHRIFENLLGLRDTENEPVFHELGQGMTRMIWNGPAGTHPGYVNAAAH